MSGIRLSPKHGVNPCIPTCYFCGKSKNEVALLGRLLDDVEAPRHACIDKRPCDECMGHMRRGIILISVKDGASGNSPYRTGKWCVVKEAVLERTVRPKALLDDILRKRAAFIPDAAWAVLGLPVGEVEK